MAVEPITFGGRLSIVVIWTLSFTLLFGFASLKHSNAQYRRDHRDNLPLLGRNASLADFRSPKDAYYTPFLAGAKWGVLVGAVLGVAVAARQR